jgi:hypothetical protein
MSKLASLPSTLGNGPRARRRTRRIALTVPLEVSGKDAQRSSFTVNTTATSLNGNGAALHLVMISLSVPYWWYETVAELEPQLVLSHR